MSNTVLTPTIIAREALMILDNNLRMSKLVYRGYESEFSKNYNGYEVGTTIAVRRPTDFTVRSGPSASIQDVTEGSFNIAVDKVKGIDFQFSSQELTLSIGELSDRVIKPAMVQLANAIDQDLAALYKDVWNWVGTPGTTLTTYAGFAKAPERLDLGAVPADERAAILSPTDWWGMAGGQTALYLQQVGNPAYRDGQIGDIAAVKTYSSQNVQTLTVGTRNQTASVMGNQSTTYTGTTNTMTLGTLGWTTTTTILQGEVFTIASVFAVNPVTKATLPYLQPFVVKVSASTVAVTASTTLTISPPIISTGAFQTVSAAAANSATITILGTASTGYAQNMAFHRNAFALVMVPMVSPPGAVDVSRQSYKGTSVRVIPYYNGAGDISSWRLDVLYGVKALDPRLAVRLSGT